LLSRLRGEFFLTFLRWWSAAEAADAPVMASIFSQPPATGRQSRI